MKKIMALVVLFSISFACYSDFDCGIGYKCVKGMFSSSGVCMKSVDNFGIWQFNLPSINSIGPKIQGGCISDMDCPIGFRCDPFYKECVR